jgi:hypothetical protein
MTCPSLPFEAGPEGRSICSHSIAQEIGNNLEMIAMSFRRANAAPLQEFSFSQMIF